MLAGRSVLGAPLSVLDGLRVRLGGAWSRRNHKQSADTGRRLRRKHQALQQVGIPAGGTRPFGWQDDKRTLHPTEAEHLLAAAQRILTGAPLSGLVVEWNEKGITTTRGNRWARGKLRYTLRNPWICGLRARKIEQYDPERDRQFFDVEIVRDADGEPVVGQWEPIISPGSAARGRTRAGIWALSWAYADEPGRGRVPTPGRPLLILARWDRRRSPAPADRRKAPGRWPCARA